MKTLFISLALCTLSAGMAYAQSAPAGPGALRRVAASCKPEAARLCPALSPTTPSSRDTLICLRPYRTSLSFNCRSAIKSASSR